MDPSRLEKGLHVVDYLLLREKIEAAAWNLRKPITSKNQLIIFPKISLIN